MSGSVARQHAEWLALVETSGPFLTLPVLQRALPQGLDPVEPELVDRLRQAYEEWRADPDLHGVWVGWVLEEVLGFDERSLWEGPGIPSGLSFAVPEHGEELRPDLAVLDPEDGEARMLVAVWPDGVPLDERLPGRRWVTTPLDRMAELLRGTGVRLGLVTNGERWTLVHVPERGATTFASWEAALWVEERLTLAAFRTLLGVERFFAAAEGDTLEALFAESANAEQEVTDQLGRQVRQAVELLVDAFGRADREQGGALLGRIDEGDLAAAGVATREELLYRAAVTVMMRLVFLLAAEERKLLPIDDDLYGQCYAVSTLRAQLQEEADRYGEEPLERRSSAWYRLLATFRMVHGGVQHEDLHLPAYGGALFDPDRFPFLEGRRPGEPWVSSPGNPLPVDDRTVLHMLDALQVLRFRGRGGVTEARRLSFRALDVEQIGHVYEGLLDHMAVTVTGPALGFRGSKEAEIALEEVERRARGDRAEFVSWLAEETGLSEKEVEKALAAELPPGEWAKLLAACGNDQGLAERVAPFHALLRRDLRDLPQVYLPGSVYVTKTSERRTSGTYYTPRSLAEEMVRHALESLVYSPGPADGADPKDWKLKSPAELLELKICDMAMGSGAFLVAACRYLADRLVEAWEELGDGAFTVEGGPARGDESLLIPSDPADRLVLARRLVADRCLYGVDKNPMAVEMAKLSLWLVTLAKDRPFSFLDHALKNGDSLLGIHDLAQLEHLHLDPARGRDLHMTLDQHWQAWQGAVKEAIERRRELESFTVLSVDDAELKAKLFEEAEVAIEALKVAGDVVVGAGLSTATQGRYPLDAVLLELAPDLARALDPTRKEEDRVVRLDGLRIRALHLLNGGRPPMQPDRRTFHWPLEFPEVFVDRGGFDAIVGNPPFQGGKKISGAHGTDYRDYLVRHIANGKKGNADLVAYFFLRAAALLRDGGIAAMLATNTIAQGDTREVGLDQLVGRGCTIVRAWKSRPWPGDASLEIGQLWIRRAGWEGPAVLDGDPVSAITSWLDPVSRLGGSPHRLETNSGRSFIGSYVLGKGFVLTPEEADHLITKDPRNRRVLKPYLNGEDLNSRPDLSPSRWVIDFDEMSEEEGRTFPDCWAIAEERVKPERMTKDAGRYPRMVHEWWKFWNTRPGLYAAIEGLDRVIAVAAISSTLGFAFVPTGIVYSHKVIVFPYDDFEHLGFVSNSFHWCWVVRYTSTLGRGINYSPTDCFETFPQPEPTHEIAVVAKALDEHRRGMMLERWEGLTKTYNRVHDPEERAADVVRLRELHVELDHAVAAAYGWDDLGLDHGFYDTPQGRRFTVGHTTRVEILDRLLELNHERYREEVAAGLHAGPAKRRKVRRRAAGQGGLGLL